LEQPPAPVANARAAKSCRIVLLEDNDAVRAATELFLSLEDYETRSAASVAGAEELLASLQPDDLLILDYHLNGSLTGLDIAFRAASTTSRKRSSARLRSLM
jgi:two-component system, sensor histidine kinase